jgi:hypothetical protein
MYMSDKEKVETPPVKGTGTPAEEKEEEEERARKSRNAEGNGP